MTLDDIYVEMKKANNAIIMAHEKPDGDAIGSSLAMCLLLRKMGKEAYVLMRDFPTNFSYLPGLEYMIEESDIKEFDIAFVMDCPNLARVNSEFIPYFENAKVKVEIDHHTKNEMFADYNVVNHVAPAASQILVSSFEYLQIDIDKEIGTCLLTGVITDTNGFRNTNVTVESFEFASWALSKGIDLPFIYKEAMLTMTRSKFEAEKLAMERMEFFENGKIAFTYMTLKDNEKIGVKPGELDGIVEIGKAIKGVEVSIFLYERSDAFKASLRSNEYVNVSEVCLTFGGGGHIKAAGATMKMSFDEAKLAIINEVKKHIK